jgi:hypothetical protein
MKRARFTEEQIIGVLREHEAGAKTADLALKRGDARLISLEKISRRSILVESARLIYFSIHTRIRLREMSWRLKGACSLATKILLRHPPLELDTVGSVLCHGPSSSESPPSRSIAENYPVGPLQLTGSRRLITRSPLINRADRGCRNS